jgi:cytochrome o ubiquinol oxidase operon protein cyoD
MTHESHDILQHPEVQSAGMGRYLGAALLALALMLIACGLTVTHALSTTGLLIALSVIGFVTVIAQLGLLFKLDLSATHVWQTVSLVLTVPLFFIAIALTIWVFNALMMRVGTGM